MVELRMLIVRTMWSMLNVWTQDFVVEFDVEC